jgi:hypothetical protein
MALSIDLKPFAAYHAENDFQLFHRTRVSVDLYVYNGHPPMHTQPRQTAMAKLYILPALLTIAPFLSACTAEVVTKEGFNMAIEFLEMPNGVVSQERGYLRMLCSRVHPRLVSTGRTRCRVSVQ